jgi:hypothetical protein
MIVQAAPYAVAREETFLESHWQSCRGVQGWLGDRNAPGSICSGALARSSASSITCKLMDYEKHPEQVALVHAQPRCISRTCGNILFGREDDIAMGKPASSYVTGKSALM